MPYIADYLEVARFRQIFDLVVSGHKQNLPPRVADLTRALDRTASSVHNQVRLLKKAGYIDLVGESNRTQAAVLTKKGMERAALISAPITSASELKVAALKVQFIPGKCGFRQIGEGEPVDFSITHLFPKWRGDDLDHIIIAENDSMIAPEGRDNPESIFPGDIVHGREGTPGQKQRVYVEFALSSGQHECALKMMERKGEMVVLHSLNPAYPPVTVEGRKIARCLVIIDVVTRVERTQKQPN